MHRTCLTIQPRPIRISISTRAHLEKSIIRPVFERWRGRFAWSFSRAAHFAVYTEAMYDAATNNVRAQMRATLFILLFVIVSTSAFAQQPPGPVPGQGFGGGGGGGRGAPPVILGPPAGMQPLQLDVFLSKNFYKDQSLWMDKRYF